jgi:FAD:protein FMN transferase
VSIVVDARDEVASTALEASAAWFGDCEACLSRFSPSSELSALNRAAGAPTRVSQVLWDALRAAVAAAEATAGLITPTVLDALEAAGYDRSFEALAPSAAARPASARAPAAQHVPACGALAFDEASRSVTLPPGVRLDLGGTAKGWAADRCAARLATIGPTLVNAGGDIALSGARAGGRPWEVAVESPLQAGEMIGVLEVTQGGVATSSRQHRRWQRDGAWRHHLIDPRTGRPAVTDVVSATVVGPSALAAEVAAKQVLLLGSDAGLTWLEAQPALAGLAFLEDGEVVETPRLAGLWSLGLADLGPGATRPAAWRPPG